MMALEHYRRAALDWERGAMTADSVISETKTSAAVLKPPPWSDPSVRLKCWIVAVFLPLAILPLWGRIQLGEQWSRPEIGLLVLTLAVVSVTDLQWRKIPNWATYPAFAWLIIGSEWKCLKLYLESSIGSYDVVDWETERTATVQLDWGSILQPVGTTLLGAFACFFVMFFVFRMAGGGAGDVKLATVIGASLGMELGIESLVASYIVAAVTILIWLVWVEGPGIVALIFLRKLGKSLRILPPLPSGERETRILQHRVALGPFFAAGTLFTLLRVTEGWL